jgi:glycosyltransferase involved in cell wall biosynthesis
MAEKKYLISVVTPCYNEEDNVEEVYRRVKAVFDARSDCEYEHIFIDNASADKTPSILRSLAAGDKNVRVILNTRNFGHIRSPYYALLQARGDAVISVVADLQDPPEMIPEFISLWRAGNKIVLAQKTKSEESRLFFMVRSAYYYLVRKLADVPLLDNVTGFGLYDRAVIEVLRRIDDPYPYFRGLICDIGFQRAMIPFTQPVRKRGLTKNNFYTLYDLAMLGITNHSKVPLRLATFAGFCVAGLSLLVAVGYGIYKLLFWNRFEVGIAPLVIGIFFVGAVQLFFTGILGEYIGAIHTQVLKRPLVIERERINFETSSTDRSSESDV